MRGEVRMNNTDNEVIGTEALLELAGELDVELEDFALVAWSECCCFSGCGITSHVGS